MNRIVGQTISRLWATRNEQQRAIFLGALFFLVAVASPAANAAEEPSTGGQTVLEEVIVTAQRREESLLEVPVSISVMSEQDLVDLNATYFIDYARGIPNLTFVESSRFMRNGLNPTIRGVQSVGGVFTTTSVYLGETPATASRNRLGTIDPNLFDLERVEVLRGPQGDLYGSSSMGGAIRLIPNRPDPAGFDAAAETALGSYTSGSWTSRFSGMVNIPLADTAALRLVATYANDDGYLDSIPYELLPDGATNSQAEKDVNGIETLVVRAALEWEITDNLTITPSYYHQGEDFDTQNMVSGTYSPLHGSAIDTDYGLDEPIESVFSLGNLEINYDLGWATILSSTSYLHTRREGNLGATGIVRDILGGLVIPTTIDEQETEEHFVEELRITTTADWPVEFTAGLFYRDVKYQLDAVIQNPAFSVFPFSPDGVWFNRQNEDSPTEEKAVFARATWHITDNLELSPGVRYSKYEVGTYVPTVQGILGYPTIDVLVSDSETSPSLSLGYTFNDETRLYARAASGYRPGYATNTTYPPTCYEELAELGRDPFGQTEIAADSLWSYEAGVKGLYLDGRLRANLSAFHVDWTDLQLTIRMECAFTVPGNAGSVQSDGGELELEMLVTPNFIAKLAVGYVDSTIEEDIPTLGGQAGDDMLAVPKWNFSVGGQYNFTAVEHPSYVRLDYAYQDDSYFSFTQTPATIVPGYGLLSGRAGIMFGNFEFALYGKNILNEDEIYLCGRDNFRTVRPDYGTCMVRPRELGIHVRWAY